MDYWVQSLEVDSVTGRKTSATLNNSEKSSNMAYFENITDNVPQMSRSINSESYPPLGGSLTDSCRSLARLRSHQRNAICRRALEDQESSAKTDT
ncbi:hypothetical protein M8J76_015310 [Diaphorina citri]|nr:hypothetical protein M8J76_015310 [Diaphorina citri]KAI5731389.1 hypothetical protein M8J77_009280 [Diaphorina citri]